MIPKIHFPAEHEALVTSTGRLLSVINTDTGVKSAASDAIPKSVVEEHRPDKDHFLLHVVAMGDGEHYGPNANGDFWPKSCNETYHDTFVKHAHYFREHDHDDVKKAMGHVVYSAYSEPMHRIELLIHGNKKKASDIYEAIKNGEHRSVSMSANVPHDRCSCCGNVAKTPAEYCVHAKYQMNQWVPEHKKFAYVINPIAKFFDISDVANPADRTAHSIEASFEKAAHAKHHAVMNGYERAVQHGVPILDHDGELIVGVKSASRRRILKVARAFEDYITAVRERETGVRSDPRYQFLKYAGTASIKRERSINQEALHALRGYETEAVMRAMVKESRVLTFPEFLVWVTGDSVENITKSAAYKEAAARLPRLFTEMDKIANIDEMEKTFTVSSEGYMDATNGNSAKVAELLHGLGDDSNADENAVYQMSMRAIMDGADVPHDPSTVLKANDIFGYHKAASVKDDAQADVWLGAYGHYKLAFLEGVATIKGDVSSEKILLCNVQHHF